MPITPLHLGPGAVFKAIGRRRFSFVVFGLTQVAMDLEAIGRFLGGSNLLHGPVHSLLGASVVGTVLLVVGKPLGERLIRLWNWRLSPKQRDWLYVEPRLTWTGTAVGAFVGTYSHVFFDSIMHTDVRPMYPFGGDNDLVGIISAEESDALCLALGVIGVLILLVVSFWRRRAHKA
ncbi:MAG: DUF4184 family protein [Bacteroidota bacterium]